MIGIQRLPAHLADSGYWLGTGHSLTFDGQAEGRFPLDGGAGNDALTGGKLDDTFFLHREGRRCRWRSFGCPDWPSAA